MTDFTSLPLPPALLQALAALDYSEMSPIQAASLPTALAGRDLLAQSPTGSGKTVTFALTLLQRIDPTLIRAQALVLCPTRELADQVGKEIRRLAACIPNIKLLLLSGGVSLRPQLASLEKHDPHIVVGTPGRVQELMRKKQLHLGGIRTLVLDEADRMLDMGFGDTIREIAGRTPPERQTLMMSATWPAAIRDAAQTLLRDPFEATVAGSASPVAGVEQIFHEVEPAAKPAALVALLLQHAPESAVVFCNTRRDVDEVADRLCSAGFAALALHGEMAQRDRDEVLLRFANRSCSVLVASDVAARGLDIDDLAAVVNYELPTDTDAYLHRIGRTARAGRRGIALNLCAPREVPRALAIETLQQNPLRWARTPSVGRAAAPPAPMVTLRLDAGRSEKMRPGDILGALTGEAGLPAEAVGRIDVFATRSYVAIRRAQAATALSRLDSGKIKGRSVRVRRL
jgi:ATP-dependent RNA helicase DbpA